MSFSIQWRLLITMGWKINKKKKIFNMGNPDWPLTPSKKKKKWSDCCKQWKQDELYWLCCCTWKFLDKDKGEILENYQDFVLEPIKIFKYEDKDHLWSYQSFEDAMLSFYLYWWKTTRHLVWIYKYVK